MLLAEELKTKWDKVVNMPGQPAFKDNYRKVVTTRLLENQEVAMREQNMMEAAPANATGSGVANWDPIMIALVRRAMPNLLAYDVCGVQPMTGPTGLIFAMRSRYTTQSGTEALYNEANTWFSGNTHADALVHAGDDPTLRTSNSYLYATSAGMSTARAESLGAGSPSPNFQEMAFSIEKLTVTARSRALKAEYTMELAQDLKAIHGLDAETELANILSTEILSEINREVIRTIYFIAKAGTQKGTTTAGIFDLDTDSNGRWSVEKFKGMIFNMDREASVIAKETRRGKANIILCSADLASALSMAGKLDYAPALESGTNLNIDDTGSTYAGTFNGRYKVYVDPYFSSTTNDQFFVMGYKGTNPYDAGMFYCPYVPLQMVRAVGQDSFQPKIGFKTRYGLIANPFAKGTTQITDDGLAYNSNVYYRFTTVKNIM